MRAPSAAWPSAEEAPRENSDQPFDSVPRGSTKRSPISGTLEVVGDDVLSTIQSMGVSELTWRVAEAGVLPALVGGQVAAIVIVHAIGLTLGVIRWLRQV